jgi:ribosomal protein L22
MVEETKKPAKKEEKKKIEAKPLPVDKEKTREIEEQMKKAKEKTEDKKEKKQEKAIVKKEEAIAIGASLPISKKHSMYICNFIKHKKIDDAINLLERVSMFKQAVPFKGEIPHRKGNMAAGRYPINASKYFINLLKSLKGNIIVNGLELEKTRIYIASASWAHRPARKGGRLAKRTNLLLKAKEFPERQGRKK